MSRAMFVSDQLTFKQSPTSKVVKIDQIKKKLNLLTTLTGYDIYHRQKISGYLGPE